MNCSRNAHDRLSSQFDGEREGHLVEIDRLKVQIGQLEARLKHSVPKTAAREDNKDALELQRQMYEKQVDELGKRLDKEKRERMAAEVKRCCVTFLRLCSFHCRRERTRLLQS